MLIRREQLDLLTDARHRLNSLAELSCCEEKTKRFLMEFIERHTSMELHDMGAWFYAVHRECDARHTVAARADFDAVPTEGGAEHLCGHDGHSAALLALALMLEGASVGKDVVLLFQHAEEIGAGARECCRLFEIERIEEIIGCHNIPQEELGTVMIRRGTFACASCGLTLKLSGKPAHAAYPEDGLNPSYALVDVVSKLKGCAGANGGELLECGMITIAGIHSGDKAFGMSASAAELWLTLRAATDNALKKLVSGVTEITEAIAKKHKLDFSVEVCDMFPATVNCDRCVERLISACANNGIKIEYPETPFRWSEDFGEYLSNINGVFFGIGAGKDAPPLHTAGYEYPDALIMPTAEALFAYITTD